MSDAPPLVVAGAHHDEIAAAVAERGLEAEVVYNEAWESGRTGSVLAARERRPGFDLCLAPVDVPLVPRAVFDALAAAWATAGAPPRGWLAPLATPGPRDRAKNFGANRRNATPAARPGHPVLVGRELLSGWTPASLDEPLRRLRETASTLWTVPVESAAVLDDLDTPGDWAALRERFGLG